MRNTKVDELSQIQKAKNELTKAESRLKLDLEEEATWRDSTIRKFTRKITDAVAEFECEHKARLASLRLAGVLDTKTAKEQEGMRHEMLQEKERALAEANRTVDLEYAAHCRKIEEAHRPAIQKAASLVIDLENAVISNKQAKKQAHA
jgi:hypothetical protein